MTARRGHLLLRAAPSAGALYAGEVYVVAARVEGLDPAVYRYDVRDHSLVEVREGSFEAEVTRSVEGPGAVAGAAAFVLLTSVFERYTWKYANRGYRYALIDSGHIGENLRLAARAAGLGEQARLRFVDDRLNALVDVDGHGEAVCALHAVGKAGAGPEAPAQTGRRLVAKGERLEGEIEGNDFERYHEATKLVEAGSGTAGSAPDEGGSREETEEGTSEAADTKGSEASVDALIRARRSPPGFARRSIARAELDFVLELAAGHAWLQRVPGVELRVVAHRVSGLGPGLYRYRRSARALEALREEDLAGAMQRACLGQEMAGSAAAGLAMVGRLRREAARRGDRSYRDLLLESGAIGQRIYLAAGARGLAARNLAAFFDDDFNRLLGLDGEERAVLHLTMLGHRAGASGEP